MQLSLIHIYNARLDRFSDRVVRGEILSGSGDILAKTNVAQDGSESRYYPYGSMFAHTVGYSTRGKTGIESLANFYQMCIRDRYARWAIRIIRM